MHLRRRTTRIASLDLLTPPGDRPVSVAELKSQLRLVGSDQDALLDELIRGATDFVEGYTGRQLIQATWEDRLEDFSDPIILRKPPLVSVDPVEFKYVDINGVVQTVDTALYTVETSREGPGFIHRDPDLFWPEVRSVWNAVRIRFTAGYGTVSTDVPADLRRAVIVLAEHAYDNPGAVVLGSQPVIMPLAAQAILDRYRVRAAA